MSLGNKFITIAENEQRVHTAGREVGRSEGQALGYSKGYDEGYDEGYTEGESVGYESGRQSSYEEGYMSGLSEGQSAGYAEGYAKGEAESYPKGYEEGYAKGEAEGVEVGREAENKAFWDILTKNNTREIYRANAFGEMWDDNSFKPPYPLKPTQLLQTFVGTKIAEGIYNNKFDFSNCTYLYRTFQAQSSITKLPLLDLRKISWASYLDNIFVNAHGLKWIDGVMAQSHIPFGNELGSNVPDLEHIIFLYEIKGSDINLGSSPKLDKESHESIMNNLSTAVTGKSVTLSLVAVNKAYETTEGANDGSTSPEWENKVAARPNWTINLV